MITFSEKLYSSGLARVIRRANRLIGRSRTKSNRAAIKGDNLILEATAKGINKGVSVGKSIDRGVKKSAASVLMMSTGKPKTEAIRKAVKVDNRVKKETMDAIKSSTKYGNDFIRDAAINPGRRSVGLGRELVETPVSTTLRVGGIVLPGGTVLRVAAEPINKAERKALAGTKYKKVGDKLIKKLKEKNVDSYLENGINSALKFGGA